MKSSSADQEFSSQLLAVGSAVRAMRKERGMSQEELAHVATIDRSHMGKIERGERNVSFANIVRISIALGCLPSTILLRAKL
ncbi:helix-turn-helix transcriptional regulator [Janthinobacterium sp. HH106]|uniref:helix-turn-helix domain-containing protein n=1 Tax=Janthinobacterium sp. HH106 TaxID=1537278 RepID=UPI0008FC263C|nr:helix-turn-helix transcriptional regulator [Janthinobacterium sp. HH106]